MRRATSNTQRLEEFDVEFVTADVTDPKSLPAALERVDVVYHLAGLVKAFRRADFDRVNVLGTNNLLEAAAARESPPVVVVVSSLAAAGPAPSDRALNETDTPQPVSLYGKSKLAAEQAAAQFADKVPLSVVRPPIVFGEGDRDVFEMFKPIAQHGLHVVAGSGRGRFSLVYAADLATAVHCVGRSGERITSPSEAKGQGWYYAAHEEQPTYSELGDIIGQGLARDRVRVLRMPIALAWVAAAGSEMAGRIRRKPQILNFDKIREARACGWSCSAEKITSQLDWRPGASLQERINQTAEWYIEQGWLKHPKKKRPKK